MSRIAETVEALKAINGELQQLRQTDEDVILQVDGKPEFFVPSFDPLIYKRYSFLNRAPTLAGRFALTGFMWTKNTATDLVIPYVVVAANTGSQYGKLATKQLIVDTAQNLGIEIETTS